MMRVNASNAGLSVLIATLSVVSSFLLFQGSSLRHISVVALSLCGGLLVQFVVRLREENTRGSLELVSREIVERGHTKESKLLELNGLERAFSELKPGDEKRPAFKNFMIRADNDLSESVEGLAGAARTVATAGLAIFGLTQGSHLATHGAIELSKSKRLRIARKKEVLSRKETLESEILRAQDRVRWLEGKITTLGVSKQMLLSKLSLQRQSLDLWTNKIWLGVPLVLSLLTSIFFN